jgi:opacity protein-like surface antigen
MKRYALFLAGLLASSAFAADVYHQGYMRSDGTYVQPHYQTAPDSNPYNNYSTQGNVNPYTGQAGTVNPYQQQYIQPVQPIQPPALQPHYNQRMPHAF